MFHRLFRPSILSFCALLAVTAQAQTVVDPANEPAVIAIRKTQPAVVNISTERAIQKKVHDSADAFFNQFFGGPQSPGLTVRQRVQSLGSGFLIDASGYIVTNEHVVERAPDMKISVTTHTGKTYEARYVTGSTESDLALLKIEDTTQFPFLNLDDVSANYLGESVLVLGNPLGYGNSITRGILSAKGRSVTVNNFEFKNLLQTDAAINPGNSGGPLVDLAGKLVGVSSVKLALTSQGLPTQGLSFAIPAETVKARVAEFRQSIGKPGQKIIKPVQGASFAMRNFGLHLEEMSQQRAQPLGLKAHTGVFVSEVEISSPAGQSPLKPGNVILRVGRFPVSSPQQIETLLEQISTGSIVDFTVGVRSPKSQDGIERQMVTLIAR